MPEHKEKKIILLANTSWYLYNFRNALIDKLISQNYKVIIIAPFDEYTSELKTKELDQWRIKNIGRISSMIAKIFNAARYLDNF